MTDATALNETALLTRREVAQLLRVTTKTIREYEKRDILHPIRISQRLVRYRAAEVKALIHPAASQPLE